MANIFLVIDGVYALLQDKHITPSDTQFLEQLLQGNKNHPGLMKLSREGTPQQLASLEQEFKQYLQQHLQAVKGLPKLYDELHHMIEEGKKRPAHYQEYERTRDLIYHNSRYVFSGKIMLPILQAVDYRLGDSKGECSGYVLNWIEDLLHHKHPFNVDPFGEPLFNPIKLDSKLGQEHPELNHGAPLTKEIARLQQCDYLSAEDSLDQKGGHIYERVKYCMFLHDNLLPKIAKSLVNSTKKNPQSAFYLSIRSYTGGHALGFYKDTEGRFHFLDVGSGWYRFDKAADFIEWLPFYFKQMNYCHKYNNCLLISFSLNHEKAHRWSLITKSAGFFAQALVAPMLFSKTKTQHTTQIKHPAIFRTHDDLDTNLKHPSHQDKVLASLVDIDVEKLPELHQRAEKTFR